MVVDTCNTDQSYHKYGGGYVVLLSLQMMHIISRWKLCSKMAGLAVPMSHTISIVKGVKFRTSKVAQGVAFGLIWKTLLKLTT